MQPDQYLQAAKTTLGLNTHSVFGDCGFVDPVARMMQTVNGHPVEGLWA